MVGSENPPYVLEIIWETSVESAEYTAMDVEKYRREFINRVVQARGKMKQRELAEILNVPLSTYKSYERRSLIPHERLIVRSLVSNLRLPDEIASARRRIAAC